MKKTKNSLYQIQHIKMFLKFNTNKTQKILMMFFSAELITLFSISLIVKVIAIQLIL